MMRLNRWMERKREISALSVALSISVKEGGEINDMRCLRKRLVARFSRRVRVATYFSSHGEFFGN